MYTESIQKVRFWYYFDMIIYQFGNALKSTQKSKISTQIIVNEALGNE